MLQSNPALLAKKAQRLSGIRKPDCQVTASFVKENVRDYKAITVDYKVIIGDYR